MDAEDEQVPKKRGRKPKVKVDEVVDVVKKKRGRKPTAKIYDKMDSSQIGAIPECIVAYMAMSDKDIEKVIGVEETKKVEKVTEKQVINFNLESDSDIKHRLNEKIKELEELKIKFDELTEKYERYAFLETVVTDNGSVDKQYYVNETKIIDNSGNYKESTDKWCKWCVHPFDTVPLGMPESICAETKKFKCTGCFCSFNCMHAHNISLRDNKIWSRLSLMMQMKKIIFGDSPIAIKPIIPAPPREMLAVLEGTMTINQFRNNQMSIPKEYNILMPPSIPIFTVTEEIPSYFNRNINTGFNKLKYKKTKPQTIKSNNLLALFD